MEDLLNLIQNQEQLNKTVEQLERKVYFAIFDFDVYECVFESGLPPFDPAYHKQGQMRHAVHLMHAPLPSANREETFDRKMIAETREWLNITLPSILALGGASAMKGKPVKYEFVPTGRTYEARDLSGQPTGETKQATVPKYITLYQTVADAETEAAAIYGRGNGDDGQSKVQAAQPTGMTKEGAYLFLKAFIHETGGDLDKLAGKLTANPVIGQFFTVTSPEVIELVAGLNPEKPF